MKLYQVLFAFFAYAAFSSHSIAAPLCVDPASDSDGDGWGWENNDSCQVAEPTSELRCVDSDGDGYGWDGVDTCYTDVAPAQCVDLDGDGWGWDGTDTCLAYIVITECIDEDGDGFGWNGIDTCLVDTDYTDPVPEIPDTVVPACIDTAPVNDTWGWDGIDSCRLAPVLTPQDTSAIAGVWLIEYEAEDEYDEDTLGYINIGNDGFYTLFFSDPDRGPDNACFDFEDPNSKPEESGLQFIPIGGDFYNIYFYDLFDGILYEEENQYELVVTENNELRITFTDVYIDYDGTEVTDTNVDLFPAVSPSILDDLVICEPMF